MKKTLFALLISMGFASNLYASNMLNGAGASFPFPIYSKWFAEYQKENKDIRFNYRPIGSGGGIRQLIKGTVDFGASDVPMKDKEKKKLSYPVVQIPMVIGAVAVIFNLGEDASKDLTLDGPTTAQIFLGEITKWNDKAIASLNPGVQLPDTNIMLARRADSSGTTAIFTKYLSSVYPTWEKTVGAGKSVKWKTGFGGKGNDGVTGIVKQTKGSIGYVELAYALNNKLSFAALKNSKGKIVTPKLAAVSLSAQALASKLAAGGELVGDISNSAEEQAYPITSMTYLLLPQTGSNAKTLEELKGFVAWALDNGDKMAEDLHYAPLPQGMKELVLKRLEKL